MGKRGYLRNNLYKVLLGISHNFLNLALFNDIGTIISNCRIEIPYSSSITGGDPIYIGDGSYGEVIIGK